MTLEEAAKKAFGCCVNMSESLTRQYFWITVRFLENDGELAMQDYDPAAILKIVEAKVEKMTQTFPDLKK